MASSKYADEGTIAHALAAMCLTEGTDAAAYVGRLIESQDYEHAGLSPSGAKKWMACPGSFALEAEAEQFVDRCFSMEVTDDMVEYVQAYVDAVRARVEEYKLAGAVEVTLLVEQRLPIDHITDEPGATGTGDAIIVAVWADGTALLDCGDLKTGMGVVVEAENNAQLQIYALGSLRELDLLYEFTRVRITIYQPRINTTPSDWETTVEDVRAFGDKARAAARDAHIAKTHAANWVNGPDFSWLNPGEHCRTSFCKARATCPKLAAYVEENVGADFEVIGNCAAQGADHLDFNSTAGNDAALAAKMAAVDLIEDWCKAVRAEVERRLLAGQPVPGYKLVQGRKGNRAWGSEAEAEALLKSMRLKQDEMYDFKLISPTSAEKVLKDSPKRWNKVTPLITQSDGKPSVAPESDKRPALEIKPVEDDFDVVGDPEGGHAQFDAIISNGGDLAG